MNIIQIRCFLAAAEELHFGRAAQVMNMLPASLSRQIRLLEERLETKLFLRTTRSVALTEAGRAILGDARLLVAQADILEERIRSVRRTETAVLKVGAIDSAAAGLIPQLLQLLRIAHPEIEVQLIEQKTIHLLPKIVAGSIDIAFCRSPDFLDPRIHFQTLLFETAIVALPNNHPLAAKSELTVQELADAPLIVPARRSRPHSYDLTTKLFTDAGLTARIVQIAEEKHTIVSLVAAGAGVAIMPSWTSRIAIRGVTFVPLKVPEGSTRSKLILGVAWARETRDEQRDALLAALNENLQAFEDNF
ncbi:LysR family transcriptional regulator [Pseudovibrio japonicus]|uniref:LysR family transcriptional regulator n=1 Tax=Pseudovibrio japonicus TaxID=366534 RepID=A0ABQ3E3A7_9HYPH|nr:LysR family transcriptional regulator [Pseudovibrio japonicus]GHB24440.1 LysR family transcriptional regulator [Pseudovibrio japonicus]